MDTVGFADPEAQRKTAEDVLMQLGLHPNQAGARGLLDDHLMSSEVHPEVASMMHPALRDDTPLPGPAQSFLDRANANPQIAVGGGQDPRSLDPRFAVASPNRDPLGMPYSGGMGTNQPAATPNIASPAGPSPLSQSISNDIKRHQDELTRLETTGSGVSQIKNPFLRGLARVGDVAGSLISPLSMAMVPGTSLHHQGLELAEQGGLKAAQEAQGREGTEEFTQARAEALRNKPDNEMQTWLEENPGKTVTDYWKAKATLAPGGKLTPDQSYLKYLTAPAEEGGAGLSMGDAYIKLGKDKAANKPETAAMQRKDIENLIAKGFPNGGLPADAMTDLNKLMPLIAGNKILTPEQKSDIMSFYATTATPAATGTNVVKRTAGMGQNRLFNALDTTTGRFAFVTPQQSINEPGRYIPAAQGQAALSKESLFTELHFNLNATREAYHNLKTPFTPIQRAQLALVLRSPDLHSAMDAFFHSTTGGTLAEDQIDLVTALASLNENAMAMRTVQGLGSGSDEMRNAIRATLPGAGTPNLEYADRQLNLLEGTINRAEQGVPKTGITRPTLPEPAKTQPIGSSKPPAQATPTSKTFTHAQVQAAADAAGISYEEAKADAIKNGHNVDESDAPTNKPAPGKK